MDSINQGQKYLIKNYIFTEYVQNFPFRYSLTNLVQQTP
jgi:hypothetical protein